ncbi:unnamed protein product [Vitrella brassicaformis CCMP3155]|uniref:ESCRT-II complex subunit VPS25 n=1 Tax=Vitrella brassicaformis (strain CCMP3155) TaxID=1169540 RepID=A0A0G4FEK5_VITBC|nr:unnamed protein product [Vitrella brassicaformis CCMP3155]|eukprot:CEM11409.1 unnamed protein product [Vitrella brassicaformis CCMP3155]
MESNQWSSPTEFWDLPPFFTIQPTDATREKQLSLWLQVVCHYCRAQRQYFIDISERMADSAPFHNAKAKRKLTLDGLRKICSYMVQHGHGVWMDEGQNRMAVFWRKPQEWAAAIYRWASDSGHLNSVETLFSLREGDDTRDQDFHGLPHEILLIALQALEGQGKAQIFRGSSSDHDGVKFFSQAA